MEVSTRGQHASSSSPGLFATVRDYGVGGSNPLSPTIYFQQFTEVLRIIKSPNVVEFAAVKPPRISKIKVNELLHHSSILLGDKKINVSG